MTRDRHKRGRPSEGHALYYYRRSKGSKGKRSKSRGVVYEGKKSRRHKSRKGAKKGGRGAPKGGALRSKKRSKRSKKKIN